VPTPAEPPPRGWARLLAFVASVLIELRKVVWPGREAAGSNAGIVVLALAVVGGLLVLFDYGLARAVSEVVTVTAR
jgi:preprotein translocase SecE subunit